MPDESLRQPRPALARRLDAARRRGFIGRDGEKELFRSALAAPVPPFAVLYVHGPAGIGKTSLLREFADISAESGAVAVWLDARDIEPAPEALMSALSRALGAPPNTAPFEVLAERRARHAIFIDTCERITPLEGWIHTQFLPMLPEGTHLVLAGRQAPAPQWRTDLGLRELVRVISLRNLRPDESRSFLATRGVPIAQHEPVLAFTHGHPLALSLVADVVAQTTDQAFGFAPQAAPQIVTILLERFLGQVPTPVHRSALEICAHVRATTEGLLRAVLPEAAPHDVFEWLRQLSFVEHGASGLFPHDLVRDVLDADLRWRDPEDYAALHRRVRNYLVGRLDQTSGAERLEAFYNILYLHRNSPFMKPYFDFASLGTLYSESAGPTDHPAILSMTERHEGRHSVRIVRHWLERQPQAFFIVRGTKHEALGYFAHLTFNECADQDAAIDPGVAAVWNYVSRHGGLRAGEVLQLERFLIAVDDYQKPSPIVNTMQIACTMFWLNTAHLAWTFVCYADAEHWRPVMSYIDFQRLPEIDFTVGPHTFGVYAHDWRKTPPAAWLDLTGERELETDLTLASLETTREPLLVVLSQPEFEDAVKQALRAGAQAAELRDNPLLRSRLVADISGDSPAETKLQTMLHAAMDSLKANPRDEKFYRAVKATFFDHPATQELAAERLGLPFGTYRYQLNTGIERLVTWLWKRELHGVTAS